MTPELATAGGWNPLRGRGGLRSAQLAVIAALLALAAVAWWVTDLRMAGMDAGPGTDPGAFGFYLSPLSFLLESWRDGRRGALLMGFEHGAWCLGCCWALMAALFALGAMSITWIALIGVLIAVEKLLPWRAFAVGGVTLVLAALAIGLAAAPSDVPALIVPNSPAAMHAMKAMHRSSPSNMRMAPTSQMNDSG